MYSITKENLTEISSTEFSTWAKSVAWARKNEDTVSKMFLS